MKLHRITLLIIVLVTSFSVYSNVYASSLFNTKNQNKSFSPDTLVQMERTICFGTCPSYTLTVFEDGNITFFGRDFVEKTGKSKGNMSPEKVELLKKKIRESNILKIPSNPECKTRYTDHSSVYLTINLDGKRHSLNHYRGCKGFLYEEELYDVEEMIDTLSGVQQWIEKE